MCFSSRYKCLSPFHLSSRCSPQMDMAEKEVWAYVYISFSCSCDLQTYLDVSTQSRYSSKLHRCHNTVRNGHDTSVFGKCTFATDHPCPILVYTQQYAKFLNMVHFFAISVKRRIHALTSKSLRDAGSVFKVNIKMVNTNAFIGYAWVKRIILWLSFSAGFTPAALCRKGISKGFSTWLHGFSLHSNKTQNQKHRQWVNNMQGHGQWLALLMTQSRPFRTST